MTSKVARRRLIGIILGGFAILPLVVWAGGLRWASIRMARAQAELEAVIGTQAELRGRFSEQPANASARELERLMDELGQSLVPPHRRELPRSAAPSFDGGLRIIWTNWLNSQLEHSGDAVAPPPAELVGFLASNRGKLDEITTVLAEGELPDWERGVAGDLLGPIPNALGHLFLSNLLLARALAQAHDAGADSGDRSLQAAWRLADTLEGRSDLISSLLEISERRNTLSCLRKLRNDPESWIERLQVVRIVEDPGRIFFGESLIPTRMSGLSGAELAEVLGDDDSRSMGRVYALATPWSRACLAEGTEAWAMLIAEGRRAGHCELAMGRGFEAVQPVEQQFSSWNWLMKTAFPSLEGAWRRNARLALELEATVQVLEAVEAARRGEFGTTEISGSCPEWRWTREITSPDRVRLEWSAAAPWSAENARSQKHPLSAEFTVRR